MCQIEADRLRFENESIRAFSTIAVLERVNDELRVENARLRKQIEDLQVTVDKQQGTISRMDAIFRVAESLNYVNVACRREWRLGPLDKRGLIALTYAFAGQPELAAFQEKHPEAAQPEVLDLFKDLIDGRVRTAHPAVGRMSYEEFQADMSLLIQNDDPEEARVGKALIGLIWQFPAY